jgi:hypothetical protein
VALAGNGTQGDIWCGGTNANAGIDRYAKPAGSYYVAATRIIDY